MAMLNSVVAVYGKHLEADRAVKELQRGGIDLHAVSIIGRGAHTDEQAVGYYNLGDRMKHWGTLGALWGGFWGLLFGSAFFMLPGLGPVLAACTCGGVDRGRARERGGGGRRGRVGRGPLWHRHPQDSVVRYETAVKTDHYVLVVHGTAVQVAAAKEILDATHATHVALHAGEVLAA